MSQGSQFLGSVGHLLGGWIHHLNISQSQYNTNERFGGETANHCIHTHGIIQISTSVCQDGIGCTLQHGLHHTTHITMSTLESIHQNRFHTHEANFLIM